MSVAKWIGQPVSNSYWTYTSPSSIRRDLTRLQNAGLVRRMHGGVTLPEPMAGVAGFYSRCNANSREKRAVARRAALCCRTE